VSFTTGVFRNRFLSFQMVCLTLFLVALGAQSALGQVAGTASLQGTIADASGAVIPSASITLTNDATHVARSAKSDNSGLYSFPNIPIGSYSLGVTRAGFQSYTQTNVVLEVGSSIAVNVKMSVGSTDQKIEVSAEGLALQTQDTSFKQTIDEKIVTEMPLNGRQMTDLITLSGASAPVPGNDTVGSKILPRRFRSRLQGAPETRPPIGWTAATIWTT
jgi:hypothetical protein